MYFDSHCHLDRIDLDQFDYRFHNLLDRIQADQVARMICVGVNLESFDDMYAQIEPYDYIYCSAGVHPGYQQVLEPTVESLSQFARHKKVVAIGETGLDYMDPDNDIDAQHRRFTTHIEAAIACDLPLIIHSRSAKQDTLKLLREHGAEKVGGVLHCFTEDWDMARQAIDLGFYISISGIVTFNQAENVREMAKKIPLERLLIETDSPWLSPAPYRGKPNHPGRVHYVAEKLAEIRGENISVLAQTTFENTNRLFKL